MELNFVDDCHHVSCIQRAEHAHVDVIDFFPELVQPHLFYLCLCRMLRKGQLDTRKEKLSLKQIHIISIYTNEFTCGPDEKRITIYYTKVK